MSQALVYDVSVQNFVAEVLQKSSVVPVMVDFWADWCGPCKTLTPMLEKLAHAYQGRFVLAKCNTEENPDIAQKLNIKSLPTIKLFIGGKLASEFNGVQPEADIRRFIEHFCPATDADLLRNAAELVNGGEVQTAVALLDKMLLDQPLHPKAMQLKARILLQTGDISAAEILLSQMSGDRADELKRMLGIYQEAKAFGALQAVKAQHDQDPKNLKAAYGYALVLATHNRFEDSMETLLKILQQDRSFLEARKALLALFEVLGLHHELSNRFRRRMASIIL